jgi:rhodanese-related sulfurtransferase
MKIGIDIKQIYRVIWQGPVLIAAAVILGLVSNTIRTTPLPLVSDWSVQARLTTESGEQLSIPLEKAKELFEKKKAVFIDARDALQYGEGHIQGARNLPWHSVDDLFMDVMQNMSHDTLIITYCDGESCNLSHDLASFLKDMGFPNVNVLVNGWTLWMENGLPAEEGE